MPVIHKQDHRRWPMVVVPCQLSLLHIRYAKSMPVLSSFFKRLKQRMQDLQHQAMRNLIINSSIRSAWEKPWSWKPYETRLHNIRLIIYLLFFFLTKELLNMQIEKISRMHCLSLYISGCDAAWCGYSLITGLYYHSWLKEMCNHYSRRRFIQLFYFLAKLK